jgi:hypothetical protein
MSQVMYSSRREYRVLLNDLCPLAGASLRATIRASPRDLSSFDVDDRSVFGTQPPPLYLALISLELGGGELASSVSALCTCVTADQVP